MLGVFLGVLENQIYCFILANHNSFALLFSVSSPDHIFLPIANWQPKENPETEDDIGPLVQHIYEVWNYY